MRKLVALAVAVLLVPGCAGDIPEDDPAVDGADRLDWVAEEDLDFDGVDLAVGSKDLPEQEILGWITVEALRAAGADVTQEVGLGRTVVAREAELAGLIDAYWEYTGTGWVDILQRGADPPTEPGELFDGVRERDEDRNRITWLQPAPLNSAFAFAGLPDVLDDLGVSDMADLAEVVEEGEEDVTFCLDASTDFDERPDGLRRFERTFAVNVTADQIVSLSTDELHETAAAGFCTVAQVYNTDPRLADTDLEVLDGTGTFIIYNPSLTVRSEVLDDVPELEDLAELLAPRLTDEVMRELRADVELDGESARDVARDWLRSEGIAE